MTSVLASTHAARFGSRAGLGATLIQTGYYMTQQDNQVQEGTVWPAPSDASDGSKMDTEAQAPSASGMMGDETTSAQFSAITQWLSFFLMAVGWLIVLSSILGFWRVKRFERSIQQSNARSTQSNTGATPPPPLLAARGRSIFSMFAVPEEEEDPRSPVFVMPENAEERRQMEWAIQEDRRYAPCVHICFCSLTHSPLGCKLTSEPRDFSKLSIPLVFLPRTVVTTATCFIVILIRSRHSYSFLLQSFVIVILGFQDVEVRAS